MGRIVVGVDGSEPSLAALRWAADQAVRTTSSLDVVMAWDDPYRYMWIPHVPPVGDPVGQLTVSLDHLVASELGERSAVELRARVVEGSPASVLVAAAHGADLLVVGNRGRGGLPGTVLGSVGLRCVSAAPCPVVVVRGVPVAHDGETAGASPGTTAGDHAHHP